MPGPLSDTSTDAGLDDHIFRKIVDLNPSPTFITDSEGFICYANKEFCRVSEYTTEEIIGKQPRILKSGKHPASFYRTLWQTIKSGKTWTGEICNRSKSGRLYWEKEIITPIAGSKPSKRYFISMRIDDMDRRSAEMLQHVQKLSGGIAHEFAQPLQVLTIMSSLLENKPERRDYIEMMQTSVERITRLVHSLKNINSLQKRDYLSEEILDLEASSKRDKRKNEAVRILIVDDEAELRHILLEGLNMEGYSCCGAEDAEQALDLLKDHSFDLIISDINMPGMDGIELFKLIRSDGYKGGFIFMTGYGVDTAMKKVIDKTDGMLMKPFQLSDLTALIHKVFHSN